ncbi:MAG: ATP-binding cassette domain-containing protein [Pseudomonadota bacterium]
MIRFRNLRLARNGRTLIEGAEFALHHGWHVGLTGRNGAGKSTLFSMLKGEIGPDQGDLERPRDWVVSHMAQEVAALPRHAIDFVVDGDVELRVLEAELAKVELTDDYDRMAQLHEKIADADGYTVRARAARVLDGLGFAASDHERPVSDFSGGWRVRLNLAHTLMRRADLLLLDEPTNHLDLDAILWLEEWLHKFEGTLFLVSHDRDFLDSVVGHIVHIEQQKATLYTGNYSQFERQRAEKLMQQQAAFVQQQAKIAHMQQFVARFGAKASKAKQAQSRLKALERLTVIAPAHADSPFDFHFSPAQNLTSPLLRLDNADLGYGERTVLGNVNLQLTPDSRIGLLGRNGAGKSTLIKALVGELAALRGERIAAEKCRIGYFAQHQVDSLDLKATPLLTMQRIAPKVREQELRTFLGTFDFRDDMALTPCGQFSGGEKSRLALAMIVWQKPNVLLLDEPTNHLDLEMREALTEALQEFDGALVVVSHDRHLLRATVDELVLVDDGMVRPFDDDLDGYAKWLDMRRAEAARAAGRAGKGNPAMPAAAPAAVAEKAPEKSGSRDLKKAQKAVADLETRLVQLQTERDTVEAGLAAGDIYQPASKKKLDALLADRARLAALIDDAEAKLLAAMEQLEAAQSG